jgi:hypothetical protein
VESGYSITLVESDDIFSYCFDGTCNIVAAVKLLAEKSGKLPVLGVSSYQC